MKSVMSPYVGVAGKEVRMKKTTKICRFCKTEIPADAKVCPNCQKKQGGHGCLVVLGVVLVIGILGSVFSGGASTPETATAASEAGAVIETKAETLAEAAVTSIEASVQETVMKTKEENVPKE